MRTRRVAMHKHVSALRMWAIRLCRRVFNGWKRYRDMRRTKKLAQAEAWQLRRNRLCRAGATQWLTTALALRAQRVATARDRASFYARARLDLVERIARHWRYLAIKHRSMNGRPLPLAADAGPMGRGGVISFLLSDSYRPATGFDRPNTNANRHWLSLHHPPPPPQPQTAQAVVTAPKPNRSGSTRTRPIQFDDRKGTEPIFGSGGSGGSGGIAFSQSQKENAPPLNSLAADVKSYERVPYRPPSSLDLLAHIDSVVASRSQPRLSPRPTPPSITGSLAPSPPVGTTKPISIAPAPALKPISHPQPPHPQPAAIDGSSSHSLSVSTELASIEHALRSVARHKQIVADARARLQLFSSGGGSGGAALAAAEVYRLQSIVAEYETDRPALTAYVRGLHARIAVLQHQIPPPATAAGSSQPRPVPMAAS